ncbi:hypothetical protein D3C80_1956570 [compost metagenome]
MASLLLALGLIGEISPLCAHSPKRSWAQIKMSGPLPVAAACWNLSVALSGCATSTLIPVSAVNFSPTSARPL